MAILRWLTLIVFKLIACMCTYVCFYPHNVVPKHNEAYMCRKTSIDCISCSLFSNVLFNNDHLKLSVVRHIMPFDLIVPMRHDGSSYVSSFPLSLWKNDILKSKVLTNKEIALLFTKRVYGWNNIPTDVIERDVFYS